MQRKQRFTADQRVDLPQYESAIGYIDAEFNTYNRSFFSPESKIVKNWTIENNGGLSVKVNTTQDSLLMNSERVGKETLVLRKALEAALTLTLADNAVNYVEVKLQTEPCAPDTVAIWDSTANGGLGSEFTQVVDTATQEAPALVSNTIAFSGLTDRLPLAIATTSGGVITLITDARKLLFHVETMYDFGLTRTDKNIGNLKTAYDALASAIWEAKGTTTAWFDKPWSNLKLLREYQNTFFTGGGDISWEIAAANTLRFTSKIFVNVAGRSATYELGIVGNNDFVLTDGQCLYVDIPEGAGPTLTGVVANIADVPVEPTDVDFSPRILVLFYRKGATIYGLMDVPDLDSGDTGSIGHLSTTIFQDRNLKMVRGGTIGWNSVSGELSISADAFIQVPGLPEVRNRIPTSVSPIVLAADGDVAYVNVNRAAGAPASLSVSVASIPAVTLGAYRVVIARRLGSDVLVGTGSFLLKHGEKLEMDGALAEINRWFSQLQVTPHESAVNKARVSAVDKTMLDGRILSQEMTDKNLEFDGAVINFTTGTILKADDATALGSNFAPFTVPVGEYFWYGVAVIPDTTSGVNRISGKIGVDQATGANAVDASAPFPTMTQAGARRSMIQVRNIAGTITIQKVRQYGPGSGSGGGSAGIEVYDEGVLVSAGITKIDVVGPGVRVTNPTAGRARVELSPSGTDNLLDVLQTDEVGGILNIDQNTIVDDFGDAPEGTKVNVAQAQSQLKWTLSNTSGSNERIREVTKVLQGTEGVMVVTAQALKPKNIVVAGNAFKFHGDVTAYFANGRPVSIAKKFSDDGRPNAHVFLRNVIGNVAKLSLFSAPSYASGPDETTVTLSNPELLDLDLDIGFADYNEKLRIVPNDFKIEFKSDTGSAYEEAEIVDAFALETIRLTGQTAIQELTGLTASVEYVDGDQSPTTGQYVMWIGREGRATTTLIHFFSSTDGGRTFTHHATTKDQNTSNGENTTTPNPWGSQIRVADNGKWFALWFRYTGAVWDTYAVYGDLSVNTSVTDTPATGIDGLNTTSLPGIVVKNATQSAISCGIAADRTDLSFIAVYGAFANATGGIRFFSAGGTTHLAVDAAFGLYQEYGHSVQVLGSGSSHRAWFAYRSSSLAAEARRYDQGTLTPTTHALGANYTIDDGIAFGTKFYVALSPQTPPLVSYFVDISSANFGATPSVGSIKQFLPSFGVGTKDLFNGSPTQNEFHRRKWLARSMIVDPADEKCVYAALHFQSTANTDGHRSHLLKVADSTNWQTIVENTNSGVSVNFRDTTSREQLAQTYLSTGGAVGIFGMSMYAVGRIPTGNTMWIEIQATTAGVPNGTVLATSETVDPTEVSTESSYELTMFNFPSFAALTAATTYAFVLKSTFPVSASNYLIIRGSTTAVFSGAAYAHNGISWSTPVLTANSLQFFFLRGWLQKIGNGTASSASTGFHYENPYGGVISNFETEIQQQDPTHARVSFRMVPFGATNARKLHAGHIMYRDITLNAPAARPTLTVAKAIGPTGAGADINLVYSVAPGTDACARRNYATGVIDVDKKGEDRSGMSLPVSSYSVLAVNYVVDSAFQQGVAVNLNGTSEFFYAGEIGQVGGNGWVTLISGRPTMLQVEIAPSSVGGGLRRAIYSTYDSAGPAGWELAINGAGFLEVRSVTGVVDSLTTASDAVESTSYHVVRMIFDGTTVRLYRASSPSGVFTEVASYSSQVVGFAAASADPNIGRRGSAGVNYFAGKIGTVELFQGVTTRLNPLWQDQHAQVEHQNLGRLFVARSKSGTNTTVLNTAYSQPSILDPDANSQSIATSHDLVFIYNHSITGVKSNKAHAKLTMQRASVSDPSAVQGVAFRFKA